MDKSLHLFDTEAEFQTKYWSDEYEEPWVSLTDENGNVVFNKSEYERMLETPLTFEITGAGDICWLFINNSGNGEAKTLEYKKNDGAWTEITSTTGLYRHAYDASSLESQAATGWTDPNSLGGMQSYYAWGRGLGWMMMAIVDVLDYLPSSHTGRTGLINILTGVCSSIKTFADPTSGVWRNVPTEGALASDNSNALESTSSSMFAYAFLKGVRKGYLPSSERSYALTLFTNLKNAFVSESGGRVTLANTCVGGNPGASATTSVGVLANYCSKDYMSDNTHGEAPYIWAALEYERLTNA